MFCDVIVYQIVLGKTNWDLQARLAFKRIGKKISLSDGPGTADCDEKTGKQLIWSSLTWGTCLSKPDNQIQTLSLQLCYQMRATKKIPKNAHNSTDLYQHTYHREKRHSSIQVRKRKLRSLRSQCRTNSLTLRWDNWLWRDCWLSCLCSAFLLSASSANWQFLFQLLPQNRSTQRVHHPSPWHKLSALRSLLGKETEFSENRKTSSGTGYIQNHGLSQFDYRRRYQRRNETRGLALATLLFISVCTSVLNKWINSWCLSSKSSHTTQNQKKNFGWSMQVISTDSLLDSGPICATVFPNLFCASFCVVGKQDKNPFIRQNRNPSFRFLKQEFNRRKLSSETPSVHQSVPHLETSMFPLCPAFPPPRLFQNILTIFQAILCIFLFFYKIQFVFLFQCQQESNHRGVAQNLSKQQKWKNWIFLDIWS